MGNADALSRAPFLECPSTITDPGDLVFLVNQLSESILPLTRSSLGLKLIRYYRKCTAKYSKAGQLQTPKSHYNHITIAGMN